MRAGAAGASADPKSGVKLDRDQWLDAGAKTNSEGHKGREEEGA